LAFIGFSIGSRQTRTFGLRTLGGACNGAHGPIVETKIGFNCSQGSSDSRRSLLGFHWLLGRHSQNRRKAANATSLSWEVGLRKRATEKQILEDADHLLTIWNERQAKRMPMVFSNRFLRARCPACHTTGGVDLHALDWHRGAAVTALTPGLCLQMT
jgi:hypothetical protein